VHLTVLAKDIPVADLEKGLLAGVDRSCGSWPMTAPM